MNARPFALAFALLMTACGPTQRELQKQEEQAKYHYDLAYGYYFDATNSNANAALAEAMKSLDVMEKNADSHLLVGLIMMGREDYLGAEKHFKRALEIRPDFHYAKNNLGTTYLAMARWDDAIVLFDALVADPTYTRPGHARNNLGWAYYKKGDRTAASREFITAISESPDLCQPYNNLTMLYLEQHAVEKADKYIERGVRRCPTYAEAYYQRARVRIQQRRSVEAVEDLQRCENLAGDAPLHDQCEALLRTLSGSGQ